VEFPSGEAGAWRLRARSGTKTWIFFPLFECHANYAEGRADAGGG